MSNLEKAYDTIVRRCLAVTAGEVVVVVADPASESLGAGLRATAARAGAEAVLALMDERAQDGSDPPAPVAAALGACDVFLAPTTRSISHTRARKAASDSGARGATLPGATADMLARLMAVDFELLEARSRAVAELLDGADEARVTAPHGTDITFDLRGRNGVPDDGNLTSRGAFGNLPCGEAFISPVSGEGTAVVHSLAGIGMVEAPVTLHIEGGRLVAADGPRGADFLASLTRHGDAGTNLAELGIGTNEGAGMTGNILEDEKILGTIHIAFGASAGIGGTVSVPVHLDCVALDATLAIGGTDVLQDGQFVLAT